MGNLEEVGRLFLMKSKVKIQSETKCPTNLQSATKCPYTKFWGYEATLNFGGYYNRS